MTSRAIKFRATILIIICLNGLTGLAQIKLNIIVSDRNLTKVEKQKNPKAKLKAYKKYYSKDSLKASRNSWKQYHKLNKDSLKSEGLWEAAKQSRGKVLNGTWDKLNPKPVYSVDSLSLPVSKDSLDWALRELVVQGEFEQIQGFYKQYGHYDSAYVDQFRIDSLQLDSLELMHRLDMKQRVRPYLPEELAQETDMDIANHMQHGIINEFGSIEKIDKSGVKDFFKNVSPEQFTKSQVSMRVAKEKFSTLPNLEKEDEGIKRNSLEGSPLRKRLYLGGHITIQATSPLVFDSDVRLGYKFNRVFSIGTGLIIREQFSNRTSWLTGDAHGYSFFTSYDLTDTYFLYGEYQAVKNKSFFHESSKSVSWEYAYLLGGGRKFQLSSKVSGSVSLLYDLNFKKNNLNARPLIIRFGYRIDL